MLRYIHSVGFRETCYVVTRRMKLRAKLTVLILVAAATILQVSRGTTPPPHVSVPASPQTNTAAITTSSPTAPAADPRHKERLAVQAKALKGADLIAAKCPTGPAKDFAKILREKSLASHPVADPSGAQQVAIAPDDPNQRFGDNFPFVTIFKSDAAITPAFLQMLHNPGLVACYNDNGRLMALNGDMVQKISPILTGLYLHHETCHLLHAPTNGVAPSNYVGKITEEKESYEYEFSLISTYGGETYDSQLNREVERIRKATVQRGDRLDYPKAAPYALYARSLDKVFLGPPASEQEALLRATIVYLNGLFRYLDRYHPSEATDRKLAIMAQLYPEQ